MINRYQQKDGLLFLPSTLRYFSNNCILLKII